MFTKPIYTGFSGHTLVDAGSQHQAGAPVICSEFGGVNIAPAKDTKSGERDWGYTTATDVEDFLKRFEKLVMAIVKGGHSCGLVYTQLYVISSPLLSFFLLARSTILISFFSRSDIEQEVNGLYSYDRKEKVPVLRVKEIMDTARDYYYDHVQAQAPKGFRKLLAHGKSALHRG